MPKKGSKKCPKCGKFVIPPCECGGMDNLKPKYKPIDNVNKKGVLYDYDVPVEQNKKKKKKKSIWFWNR